VAHKQSKKIIATAFGCGKEHDFALFKRSKTHLLPETLGLGDSAFQGMTRRHTNSKTPKKRSKAHPLSQQEKAANRELARERIVAEHIIRCLKVFRILSERYRNRRKRFGLRFNLIAAIYNYELELRRK
jgi:DDE superfamily endonuclease